MGRKKRDLFEILGERRSKSGSGGSSSRRRPAAPPGPVVLLYRLVDWVRGSLPSLDGKRRGRSRQPSFVRAAALTVAVVVALGAGFVLGRVTATTAGESGLRAPSGPASIAARWDDGVALGPEKETECLSTIGYPLLRYSAQDRSAASAAARWLRERDVPTARIRSFSNTAGETYWVVIVYVDDPGDATVYRRLRSLATDDPSAPEGLRRGFENLHPAPRRLPAPS